MGTFSKFTSFWRGPYKVVGKLSSVLYKVDCGRGKTIQVVHCDRIRKCKQQFLKDADLYDKDDSNFQTECFENANNEHIADSELHNDVEEIEVESKRKRSKPV